MENDIVGKKFINKAGSLFVVTKFVNSDSKNRYYEVLFPYTGYKGIFTKTQIIHSSIKDRYLPTVAGVGFLGNAKCSRKDRTYSVWHNMIQRCYNPKSTEYIRYGALGVKVCLRWHNYENFKNDIVYIPGYNEELFQQGLIQLDKDKLQLDTPIQYRIYSPHTCEFITPKENTSYCKKRINFNEFLKNNKHDMEIVIDILRQRCGKSS